MDRCLNVIFIDESRRSVNTGTIVIMSIARTTNANILARSYLPVTTAADIIIRRHIAERCMRDIATVARTCGPPYSDMATYTRAMNAWLKTTSRAMKPSVSLVSLYASLQTDIQLRMYRLE